MHCFSYGSNLNIDRLRNYVALFGLDTETIGVHSPAILKDHRLRTNYVSTTHRAGACNIEATEGSIVEGVVTHISSAVRNALRIKEGWPQCYQEVMVDVLAGDRQEPLRALTYIVAPDHRLDMEMPVTSRYRRLVLEGAEAAGLTEAYQAQLRTLLRTTETACNMAHATSPCHSHIDN